MNSVEPTIKFSLQRETNHEIPFLDVSVCRQDNGPLASKVYRMPTHTERYLALDSHHPIAYKKAVVRSLTNRANYIPTISGFRSETISQHEIQNLRPGLLGKYKASPLRSSSVRVSSVR